MDEKKLDDFAIMAELSERENSDIMMAPLGNMKKIVVVGAGVGGLVCAAKLAKAGLDVTLLEHHYRLGGSSQTWARRFKMSDGTKGEVLFELTHCITGFGEDGNNYKLYKVNHSYINLYILIQITNQTSLLYTANFCLILVISTNFERIL